MRSCLLLMSLVLPSAAVFAQPPAPVPVPSPSQKVVKEVKPDDIKGELLNPVPSVKSGQVVSGGDQLVIEFDYKTEKPGEYAVAVEVFVDGWAGINPGNGNAHPGFAYQPCTLSEKSGKGRVAVSYVMCGGRAPDLTANRVNLYLWPIHGAKGRRDALSVNGPIKFEGSEIFTPSNKARFEEMQQELAELRKTVERLEKVIERRR